MNIWVEILLYGKLGMSKVSVKPFVLVLVTVVLGLMSAWALNEAAREKNISMVMLMFVLGAVAVVNAARFFIWGFIHKRYPISMSYPLNSMFFPLIFVMGYFYGEAVSMQKILGIIFITTGVSMITFRSTPGERN